MTPNGAFTFVLHSHMPYARLAGRWPHGEEWIHEACAETYVPLLKVLHRLRDEGIAFRLTMGITPILAEQLADAIVLDNFDAYLNDKIAAAQRDVDSFQPENITRIDGQPEKTPHKEDMHLHLLASYYKGWYEDVRHTFHHGLQRDILGAFRRLQDEGYIDIATSAATHAYLPLLGWDGSIQAQIRAGIASYERHFGRRPSLIWLPECAYRPAYLDDNDQLRPGLETFLAQEGIRAFFSESHTITGGHPVGVAEGDIIGPYGAVKRRYVIPQAPDPLPRRDATTFLPYRVSKSADPDTLDNSGVVVIGRNQLTGEQVWSNQNGYPGDFDYREFHKRAGTSGLHYWRVTGDQVELAQKDYYYPEWADFKVEQHAEHFAHLVGDLLRDFRRRTGHFGILAASYDAELFGHWWFEGISWLEHVLRFLAGSGDVALMTATEYLADHPPQTTLHLPEGSWGAGGAHFTWMNGDTEWMWGPVYECEKQMETLAQRFSQPNADEQIVLNQAARELLLLQSSDWPFLVTTGQAREYAIQRFSQHVERFKRLVHSLEENNPDVAYAQEMYEIDKVFADMDFRWFVRA